ncbi:MAG: Fic family protein [Gemmatimonadales bacterium]
MTWPANVSGNIPRRFAATCKYRAFLPVRLHDLAVPLDAETVGAVSEAEHAIRDLNNTNHRALGPLARLLLRTESIASSKIEGMQVDVPRLARAEARTTLAQRIGPDAERLLANVRAMQVAVDEAAATTAFSVREIEAIHLRLMTGDSNFHAPGIVRELQNWIGGNNYNPCGAAFVPPPPDRVAQLLDDLCAYVNLDTISPLVQAATVHAQFETIHPFGDGNGRTGRALIHVILRRRGIAKTFVPPISLVFAAGKDRYIDGLTRFRGDDVASWIADFADAATQAALIAQRYVAEVEALQTTWRERLRARRALRSDSAAWLIIDLLPAHPIVTAAAAIAATGRDKSSVSRALDELCEAGILRPSTESKRNQLFEAAGLLDLIAQMEEGRLVR